MEGEENYTKTFNKTLNLARNTHLADDFGETFILVFLIWEEDDVDDNGIC